MKLAKKISKSIALCAVLTIIGVMWGGVIISCSNGSDDFEPIVPPVEENPDVPEDWTAITVGDIEKYAGKGGTASYTVTKNADGSITISHDAVMALYASCSFKQDFGDNNTLYTKITNNSDVDAMVQVQVNKAGTEANGFDPTPTVTAVYVDGKKQPGDDVSYSVACKIPANGSVVIANKFDPEKKSDTIAISLNSQEGVTGTVEKGKITVSGISMKKITEETELETPAQAPANPDPTNPAKPNPANPNPENPTDPTKPNPETPQTPVQKSIAKVDEVTFVATAASVGADATNLVFTYDRSKNGAKEKITIKDCNIEVLLNDEKVTTLTELDFALNEYKDGDKDFTGDKATQYQCKKSIGKKVSVGDTVKVVFKAKTGKVSGEGVETAKIDTLTVSLIDNDKDAGDPNSYYNELVPNNKEYQPLFPKTEDPETPPVTPPEEPKETVFDFTKAVTDGEVKLENVTYCSADVSKFSSENGLTLAVSNSWDGAFKIATNSLDLSNKNCIVEYKIEDGWKYSSANGKKCLIQLISKEQNSGEYKAIELSQGEFANDPAEIGSWKTATIDNIYKNNWDVVNDDKDKDSYIGADLTKILAIKINTTDGVGTIHIKSIKFVDKE